MVTYLSGGRGWMQDDAAASVARIDARLGRLLEITEAGRTRARQQQLWDWWWAGVGPQHGIVYQPAHPGTSPHETGLALDTDEHDWMMVHGPEFGFLHDVVGDRPHFVYHVTSDTHHGHITPSGGTVTPLNKKANTMYLMHYPVLAADKTNRYFVFQDGRKPVELVKDPILGTVQQQANSLVTALSPNLVTSSPKSKVDADRAIAVATQLNP